MLATTAIFTTGHIAATAAISGALALFADMLLNRRAPKLWESLVVGLLTAVAVFLWRKSANMPALNNDGLQGFSANDWLAPTLTFVVLSVYQDLRATTTPRFPPTRAAATIIAFAVNVLTI